jgi:glutathione S-transferase
MQLLANTTSPFVRIVRTVMIEKGFEVEPTIVDPWADDARLRAANAATRVPTLVLDDGTPMSECLLIVQWLQAARPEPAVLGTDPARVAGVLSRAGIAIGAIEASTITIITRKVTAPVLFDETPVGLRRRRSMIEGMQRLEAAAGELQASARPGTVPALDAIAAVTLFDYQQFRYATQPWLPGTPALQALAQRLGERDSFRRTRPC